MTTPRALVGELGGWFHLRWATLRPVPHAVAGRHKVIVIPGLFGHDMATRPLRRALVQAGYDARGWELGVNLGARPETLDQVEALVARVAGRDQVTLIGWSVGGVFAREVAKRRPERVARVITLGSPFSGDLRQNNFWRVYERVSGHPVDRPPLAARPHEKPPVPTVALWSRRDGIIAAACARGLPHESDDTVEVGCNHLGYMTCPRTARTVVGLLAD